MMHQDNRSFLASDPLRALPLVSIITPVHNGAGSIAACLRSVQAQHFRDYEHIVVDNNSTDASCDIILRHFQEDPRIRLLHNRERKGAGPTRNTGIEAARSRYIAFLDCDDVWLPLKLERQLADMSARGLALSWTSYAVHKNGTIARVQRADRAPSRGDILTKRAVIGALTAVYDTRQLGKVFQNDWNLRQDFCLWLDITRDADAKGLRYGGLDEVLATYFVHAGGISRDKKKAALVQWRVYRQYAGLSRSSAARFMLAYTMNAFRDRLS